MIVLPPNNPLVESILEQELQKQQDSKQLLDVTFADFDRAIWTLKSTETTFMLSVTLSEMCHADLFSSNASASFSIIDHLKKLYPAPVFTVSGPASEVTSALDKSSVALQWPKGSQVDPKSLSMLKRNLMAAPIIQSLVYYDKWSVDPRQYAKEQGPLLRLAYREHDAFYVQAFPDRMVMIFATTFQDPTDAVLGKVFLQEFVDARKGSSMQNAPQVIYSKEPPAELALGKFTELTHTGYISFILFAQHIQPGHRRETAINMLVGFRSYFHYHIKCSKAYMHSRLRAKMGEFMKVLNRAYPEHVKSLTTKLA